MSVTSLDKIKEKAAIEVTLPGWDNEPFICKLRRVNLMDMAAKGNIPNPLMATVIELFEGKITKESIQDPEERYKKLNEGIEFFAKKAMVEPSYEEVTAIVPLTDNQKYAIYKFAVDGTIVFSPSNKK